MTKDNPVAAGVAELLPCPFCGSDDIRRDHNLRNHHEEVFCDDCGATVSHEGMAPDAIAAWNRRTASPVQAGIDPLVARLENWGAPQKGSAKPLMREAAALLRSQAERIAALEEAATAKDIEHRAQLYDISERFRAVNIQRVIEASGDDILAMRDRLEAAESLLAEAREALGRIASNGFGHPVRGLDTRRDKEMLAMMDYARATLSRLKPGEKGGEV